jgi:SAM-dependent methyltransferase
MTVADIKDQIRDWWAGQPMTYGEQHGATTYTRPDGSVEQVEIGSRRFFELADERFYGWNTPLHDAAKGPFSDIYDYRRHAGQPVLEVGCGMGCMAMNWATRGARMTAVDLNPVAIAQTRRRFEVFGLEGDIREADAEQLPFAGDHFSFAYSWGVLHHTPGIRKALKEIHRVLKPGAGIGVMLYHRTSFLYRYTVAYQDGFVNMERRFLDELQLASRYGDGGREEGNPHTWPVTKPEITGDLFTPFEDVQVRVLGTDVPPILDTWRPRLGQKLSERGRAALAGRWGWSLWITGRKQA